MNKLITLALTLLLSVTGLAQTQTLTTLWEGEHDLQNWDNRLEVNLNGQKFSDGDQINIYYSGDGQIQYGPGVVDVNYTPWNDYDDINGSVYEISLNAERAAALTGDHLTINGKNLILTKIELVSTSEQPSPGPSDENVAFEGSWDLGGWDHQLYVDLSGIYFAEGDKLTIHYSGNGQIQYGAGDEDNYKQWVDYEDINGSTYEITLTADQAKAISNGTFSINGRDLTISKITYTATGEKPEEPEQPVDRKFEMVDLFIPGVYPSAAMNAKTEFGLYSTTREHGVIDKENGGSAESDALAQAWMGTGRMVNLGTDENPDWKYMMYEEWWDATQIADTENPNFTSKHWYQRWYLDELNTYPIRLSRDIITNFAKVKRGDIIIVNITSYDPRAVGTPSGTDENNTFDLGTQGQLGTYDPADMDADDPWSGFEGITLSDGNDYRDFGNGTYEIEFTVGPLMLEQITRYGLAINGRRFYLNSVKAKVFIDQEENFEGDAEETVTEAFYNYIVDGSEFSEVYPNSIITVTLKDGALYNEEVVAKYKGTGDNRVYIGSTTNWYDDAQTDTYNSDMHIRYSFVTESGVETRLHVMSRLHDNHFPAAERTEAPARVSKAADDNKVYFIDGIEDGSTSKHGDYYRLNFRVTDPAIVSALKANGMKLRGARYDYESIAVDNSLTGIDDVTTDKIDLNAPVEIYDLTGIRVTTPVAGRLYIVRQGNKVEKVVIQ